MRNSSRVTAITPNRGAMPMTTAAPPAPNRETMKPAKTFRITCPANMLAARRMASDTGRDRKEITSTGTSTGKSQTGTPEGAKSLKNFRPFFQKP